MVHSVLHLLDIVHYVLSIVQLVLYFGNTLILYLYQGLFFKYCFLQVILSFSFAVFLLVGGFLTSVSTTQALVVYLVMVCCGAHHVPANEVVEIRVSRYFKSSSFCFGVSVADSLFSLDYLDIELLSTCTSADSFQGPFAMDKFNVLLDYVMVCSVSTVRIIHSSQYLSSIG